MPPIVAADRVVLDAFAKQVRLAVPAAAVWAFGSRARGTPHPDSDLDVCVVVPELTREVREVIYRAAWEVGFERDRLLAPVILTTDDFENGPMSASTLVANIRRDGVVA
jgi:predicted nucleotidyltransferase